MGGRTVTLVVTLTVLAAAHATAAAGAAEVPRLTVGDYWTYVTLIPLPDTDETIREAATVRVAAVEDVEAFGATVRAYRVEYATNWTRGEGHGSRNSTSWWHVESLATVRDTYAVNQSRNGQSFQHRLWTIRDVTNSSCQPRVWPLTVDASWESSCRVTTLQQREAPGEGWRRSEHVESAAWRVTGIETVDVPAGSFRTYRLVTAWNGSARPPARA